LADESHPAGALLSDQDPPPFRAMPGDATSAYVITCDHAGRAIPQGLGTLGVSAADLDTHVAWDIGAAGVAEQLGALLGGFVILQTYSRLVIDCNRPLHATSSIAAKSEYTVVPGNQGITRAQAELRAEAIFHPYHRRIDRELERHEREGRPAVFVAVHSFTPRYMGADRVWHAGVLYGKDARLGRAVLELLRKEAALVVGDNEPYAVSELTDYGIVQHAERRGLLCVELEVRQDLIAEAPGQAIWAERLARVLSAAVARLSSL
jgi:predicted N-formylglutamate amidohydrolase